MGIVKDVVQGVFTGLLDTFLAPLERWIDKRNAVKAALTSQKLVDAKQEIKEVQDAKDISKAVDDLPTGSAANELQREFGRSN